MPLGQLDCIKFGGHISFASNFGKHCFHIIWHWMLHWRSLRLACILCFYWWLHFSPPGCHRILTLSSTLYDKDIFQQQSFWNSCSRNTKCFFSSVDSVILLFQVILYYILEYIFSALLGFLVQGNHFLLCWIPSIFIIFCLISLTTLSFLLRPKNIPSLSSMPVTEMSIMSSFLLMAPID